MNFRFIGMEKVSMDDVRMTNSSLCELNNEVAQLGNGPLINSFISLYYELTNVVAHLGNGPWI